MMNTPLFDRAMLLKLFAVFTFIGAVAVVLPIPRFNSVTKLGFESPLHQETALKVMAIEQAW